MSVVGVGIISKRGERRKYLPLEMRMKMYEDVIELRKQGLKHEEIQRRIYKKYGMRLPQPTISVWINGKHNPYEKINKFNEKPSPELAYIIGVIFSDGYKYLNNGAYLIWLAVNDEEYAREFGRCLARVLEKKGHYEPFYNEKQKQWIVAVNSVLLFKFLEKPFEELKFYIEYSEETVASFLRAMFDGDGCIHTKIKEGRKQRILVLTNTNEKLLVYIQYLLKKYFSIEATGPHLSARKNSIRHFPNGKISKTTKDYYYIYIRAKTLLNFYNHIGFTIKQKQQKQIEAIE
jgi:intein-encoded DNA endonuclease-like protein